MRFQDFSRLLRKLVGKKRRSCTSTVTLGNEGFCSKLDSIIAVAREQLSEVIPLYDKLEWVFYSKKGTSAICHLLDDPIDFYAVLRQFYGEGTIYGEEIANYVLKVILIAVFLGNKAGAEKAYDAVLSGDDVEFKKAMDKLARTLNAARI